MLGLSLRMEKKIEYLPPPPPPPPPPRVGGGGMRASVPSWCSFSNGTKTKTTHKVLHLYFITRHYRYTEKQTEMGQAVTVKFGRVRCLTTETSSAKRSPLLLLGNDKIPSSSSCVRSTIVFVRGPYYAPDPRIRFSAVCL